MASATKVYTTTRRVRHDNTVYAQGEEIKLTQAQADPLLHVGAITADKPDAENTEE